MTRDTIERRGPTESDSDSALIDEAFDRALDAFGHGEDVDPESLAHGHEHLRAEIQDAVRLAREVSAHASECRPDVHELAGYEIECELGAGSMGTVFLARQRSLGGRRVALKVLPPSLGLSASAKNRFLAEANALAKLEHPNVVGVHDVVDADGIVAFAMDWVPGGSLARVLAAWRADSVRDEMEVLASCLGIERADVPHPNAVAWLLQSFSRLARALAAVHQKGLLHRDIKPGNLLVRGDGELLLSDFGLVRDSEAAMHTRTGQFLGTFAYSPPEQLRGEHDAVGPHSDVYSLGATLYEALALQLPFAGRTASEMHRRAEDGRFEAPRRRGVRLPRDLATILEKALDPDRSRRYGRAEDLAEDLERLITFRPILARPARAGTRLVRFLRRNRAAVVPSGVASLLILAIAIQGSRWWLGRQRADEDAREARKRAQLAVLESRTADRVEAQPENLEEARRLFEEARAFRPNPDLARAIELEAGVIELAIALAGGHEDRAPPAGFDEGSLTLRYFRSWKSGVRPTRQELDTSDSADRRAYGLLAYLKGEPEQSFDAWRRVAGVVPIDYFADALIGEYLREQGQYERAYALLRPAVDYYSEAEFLSVRLADVAVGLGYLELGEDLLEKVKPRRGHPDSYDTGIRVQADLFALRGEDHEACLWYDYMLQNHQGKIARLNYAQFLELRGKPLEALRLLDGQLDHEFVRLADEWWDSGSEPTWQKLCSCLTDPDPASGPFPKFVQRYRSAQERIQTGKAGGKRSRSPFTPLLAERRKAVEARVPSLLELARNEDLARLDVQRWRQLPAIVQSIHAIALCSVRR